MPPRNKPKSREKLRERITLQWRYRILREGFSRVPVDQIAEGLGISKKSLYGAFATKHELVEAIVESFLAEMKRNLETIVGKRIPFVRKFWEVMLLLAQGTSRIGKPFLIDLERHMPDLWERVQQFRRERILTNFSSLLQEGIEDGSIRPIVTREVFLASYLAAIDAVVSPSFLMNQPLSTREAMTSVLELFFHGALTPQASRRIATLAKHEQLTQGGDFHL